VITRRSWLGAALASPVLPWNYAAGTALDCGPSLCGTPVPFQITRQPGIRVALESMPNLDLLKTAYAALQPGSGDMSLAGQRDLHKFYSGYNPPGFDVHSGPPIFLWHRWFLYFHECLLSRMVGQPITLPYWNGSLDPHLPLRAEVSQPPLRPVGAPCQGQPSPATQALSVLGRLRNDKTLQSAFDHVTSWHEEIHLIVTYVDPRPCLMPNMETAAADPLFYFFHTQFDRVFDWWRGIPGVYMEPEFVNQPFTFVYFPMDRSVAPSCVCVRAGDALKLNYAYDDPTPRPRHGSFQLTGAESARPPAAVELHGFPLIPGVTEYRVTLSSPRQRLNLGLYHVLAHHTHLGRWRGRPVFPIPPGFDLSRGPLSVVLAPLGNRPPIRLSRDQFSIQTLVPLI
jgi:hypothetical protein